MAKTNAKEGKTIKHRTNTKKDGKPTQFIEINASLLRVLMQERGYTIRELAEEMDVTYHTLYGWLWAKNRPLKKNLLKLADALDISPHLIAIRSTDLVERGRTTRSLRFYAREMLGLNEPPDYREIQLIEQDLTDASDRDSEEEEVRAGEVTVPSEAKSSGHPKPDPKGGDGV